MSSRFCTGGGHCEVQKLVLFLASPGSDKDIRRDPFVLPVSFLLVGHLEEDKGHVSDGVGLGGRTLRTDS